MFQNSKVDCDLSKWPLKNLTSARYMFANTTSKWKGIGNWPINKIEDTTSMFARAVKFNDDITNWNMSNIRACSRMFDSAEKFSQNLSTWKEPVEKPSIGDRIQMFKGCPKMKPNMLPKWAK